MKGIKKVFHTYGITRTYSKGQLIFDKGQFADEIYLIESGRVRAYLLYPDGSERTLCYVGPGNFAGEEIMSETRERIVSTDAADDLTVYVLKKESLIEHAIDEGCMEELLTIFMKKIEVLSEWIFYGQFNKAEEKVAYFLYSNSNQSDEINFTQDQIASVTGITRASVSSCLKKFSERGISKVAYGRIYILDRESLKIYFGNHAF